MIPCNLTVAHRDDLSFNEKQIFEKFSSKNPQITYSSLIQSFKGVTEWPQNFHKMFTHHDFKKLHRKRNDRDDMPNQFR